MGNWCWGWCCGGSEFLWVGCTGVAPDYQNTLRKYTLEGEFVEGTGIPNYPDSESMSPQGIDFDSAGDVYTCHTNVGIFNPERGIAKNSRSNLSLGWYNKNHPLTYYDLVVVDNHEIIGDAVYGAASGNNSTVQQQIRKFSLGGIENTSESFPVDLGLTPHGIGIAARCIDVDSSGNLWVGHDTFDDSDGAGIFPTLSKYTSTGALIARYQPFEEFNAVNDLWQSPLSLKIDADDNIYVSLSPAFNSGGAKVDHLKKLNSSAVEIWGVSPDNSGNQGNQLVLFDDESKVAVVTNEAEEDLNCLYVYDSDGTFLWGKSFAYNLRRVTADSSNHLYVSGFNPWGYISKFDIDGNEITDDNFPIDLSSSTQQVTALGAN